MDQIDKACQIEESDREAALAELRARNAQLALRPSAEECVDCGDVIPRARRLLVPGVQRCTDCAELREIKARRAA